MLARRKFPVLLTALAIVCVHAEAVVPQFSCCLTWSPHLWELWTSTGNALWNEIWDIREYHRVDLTNWDCTLPALKAQLTAGVGIYGQDSHGESGGVPVESYPDRASREAKLAQYWEAYPEIENQIYRQDWEDLPMYGIAVASAVVRGWCQTACAQAQGIAYVNACNSADSGITNFNCRVAFGYTELAYTWDGTFDISAIFGRMSGSLDEGLSRQAGSAYAAAQAAGGLSASIRGTGDVELCPVVATSSPYNGAISFFRRTGGGFIQFSSDMAGDTPGQVVPGPGVTWQLGHEPQWAPGSRTVLYFCYRITGPGGTYSITVKGATRARTLDMAFHPLSARGKSRHRTEL